MTTSRPHRRATLRSIAAGVALTAAALTLSACFGHGVKDAPDDPAPQTQSQDTNREMPILRAEDLPTVEDANLDRTNPSSVSYHWLRIARTILPDLDLEGEAYQRVKSLSTPEFQKANESYEPQQFVTPWYQQGESLSDPVLSVNARVTSMGKVDEFHEFGGRVTREWTVVQTAVTKSGEVLATKSSRVILTLVADGDNWLVDRISAAE